MHKSAIKSLHLVAILLPLTTSSLPAQVTIHDTADHLTFDLPSTWLVATHDRELSTFHQEARTAPKSTRLRYVAAIPENPFPLSTFSGAHIYISLVPHLNAAQCEAQVTSPPERAPIHYLSHPEPLSTAVPTIAGRKASHGHDEHGILCTEYRDDIYTIPIKTGCLRFDLAMNNFCGGEVSGARDMTHDEIIHIRERMEEILNSVRIGR